MKPAVNLINDLFGCPTAKLTPCGWARIGRNYFDSIVKSNFLKRSSSQLSLN